MKSIQTIKILALIFFSVHLGAQDYSVNISVATPKVKAVDNKENLRNVILSEIEESILNCSDFVSLVEREYMKQVTIRRKKLKRDDNPNVASSAMIGANYLLESKLSEVKVTGDSIRVVKYKDTKKTINYVYTCRTKFTIDFELIDIETGEVADQYKMNIDGYDYAVKPHVRDVNKVRLVQGAMNNMRTCMGSVIEYMLLNVAPVKAAIIDINEIDKKKAKKLLIKGGQLSPFRDGLKFKIVKIYEQDIAGDKIQREEKIGEAKLKQKYHNYSECKVTNGKEQVLMAFNEGAKLYCIPIDLKRIPTCVRPLSTRTRTSRATAYKAAIKSDPKPDPKAKSKKSTTSSKKRKVTRKSGN